MKQALAHLKSADPALAKAIARVGPYRVEAPDFDSAYQALSRSVVYQQLSGKAARTIHGRFTEAFGDGERPRAKSVAGAEIEALRAVGLSRQKASYLQGLAEAELAGAIPSVTALKGMDDDAVIEALTALKGIGEWTVQMLLMAWMRRPDVLPAADLGIRKGFQQVYGLEELPAPAAVLSHGERWRPWRSVASWYLWRVLDTETD